MDKKENAQKWIDALRSGEYKQGRRVLRREDCYCTLGVLCDVYSKETGGGKWRDGRGTNGVFRFCPDGSPYGSTASPSLVALEWAGVEDAVFQIMDWNDRQYLSFPEIADRLEATIINGAPING